MLYRPMHGMLRLDAGSEEMTQQVQQKVANKARVATRSHAKKPHNPVQHVVGYMHGKMAKQQSEADAATSQNAHTSNRMGAGDIMVNWQSRIHR